MSLAQQQDDPLRRIPTVFPREFEKHLAEYIDTRFVVILCLSLLAHMLMVGYFAIFPPSLAVSALEIDKIQKRFANLILDQDELREKVELKEPEPIIAETEPEKKPEEPEPAKTPVKKTDPKPKKSEARAKPETRTAAAAPRRSSAQIKQEVRSQGILGLLSSTGSSASGALVQDVLGKGMPDSNLDRTLNDISGLRRATAGDGAGGKRAVRGARSTEGGDIDNLVSALGRSESAEVARTGDLQVDAATPLLEGDGEMVRGARDVEAVSAIVQAHNSAIQYCYQRELKRNPSLKGKIVIRFSINPQGLVQDVEIVSSTLKNRRVENCVVSRIKRWNNFGAIDPTKGETTIRQVYTFGY